MDEYVVYLFDTFHNVCLYVRWKASATEEGSEKSFETCWSMIHSMFKSLH